MPKNLKRLSIWIAGQLTATAILTAAWHLILKLAENAVIGWTDNRIGELIGPNALLVISWVLPVALAIATLFAFYHFILWRHQLAGGPSPSLPPSNVAAAVSAPIAERGKQMGSEKKTEAKSDVPDDQKIEVSSDAPENWERLFSIEVDPEKNTRSLRLNFLPDTKKYKADTLLLVVYGYKVLLDLPKVSVRHAHWLVSYTVNSAPNKPTGGMAWLLGPLSSMHETDDYADEYLRSYLERIDLSQGGRYRLTEDGERQARALAYDLIRRA